MTAPATRVYTWEDALKLPRGERYEVINGELRERQMSFRSSEIAMAIGYLLGAWMRAGHPGWVTGEAGGFTIFPWTAGDVRMPDVAYTSRNRAPTIPEKGWLDVVPEFAVEVVSPNDLASDVDEKAQDYIRAGVPLVWVVYPRTKTVVVYRPGLPQTSFGTGDLITGGDVLPGFEVKVDELFDFPE